MQSNGNTQNSHDHFIENIDSPEDVDPADVDILRHVDEEIEGGSSESKGLTDKSQHHFTFWG